MKPLPNVTAVSIGGRGVLIGGPPGSGKSSLALELMDRGASLIGDDGILLEPNNGRLIAHPPAETGGLIEIRNVGIVERPAVSAPVCLCLALAKDPPRLPLGPDEQWLVGHAIPSLEIYPGKLALALRVEAALDMHGLQS